MGNYTIFWVINCAVNYSFTIGIGTVMFASPHPDINETKKLRTIGFPDTTE